MKLNRSDLLLSIGWAIFVRFWLVLPVFMRLLRGEVPDVLEFSFLALATASILDAIGNAITNEKIDYLEKQIEVLTKKARKRGDRKIAEHPVYIQELLKERDYLCADTEDRRLTASEKDRLTKINDAIYAEEDRWLRGED